MAKTVAVAVVIPTYRRGDKVLTTLRKIMACDPLPAEIWIHVDQTDGLLEAQLAEQFPTVRVISSTGRLGPGGGRHRCLELCAAPLAVSFDDDSYPCDSDFFERVVTLFAEHPNAGVVGAAIWHPHQAEIPRATTLVRKLGFTGCGHAIRLSAYRDIPGYVPRGVAYGMEEADVSLQLFARKWTIYESGELRVFHDTALAHHRSPEITEGVVTNVALLAFLRYPVWFWFWGLLQVGSMIRFCLRAGRWRGVFTGVVGIPAVCLAFRRFRHVLPTRAVFDYLRSRSAIR